MKFSIIIPCYKVEQYLHQCVDSVLAQTFEDYEVILVDDGSPDGCPAICDEYGRMSNKIKVIHKPNGGLSDARNVGQREATGDYVVFVDSDDFWRDNNCLQKINMVLKEKPQTDLIFFNVVNYDNKTGKEERWASYTSKENESLAKDDSLVNLISSGTVPMSAWSKVIRRQTLVNNNIVFHSKIYGEDIPWFIDLMEKVENVVFLNEYFYAYRQNVSSSITKSNQPKHVRDMKWIIQSELEKLAKRDLSETGRNCIEAFIAYNYCILMSQYVYVKGEERSELWNFLERYKNLLTNERHPKVIKVKKMYDFLGLKNTCRLLNIYNRIR